MRLERSNSQGHHAEELKAVQSKTQDIVRAEQNGARAISPVPLAQDRTFSGATSMTFRLLASPTKYPGVVSSNSLEVCWS